MAQRVANDPLVQQLPSPHFEEHEEIDRSVDILNRLAALDPAALVSRRPPVLDDTLVSIAVGARNVGPYIESCIKGLLSQTHTNFEAFIVDDASEDDTFARMVRSFGRDARLCLLRLQRRAGRYQILNHVIKHLARARFVAMQDADDISHPDRLAAELQAFAQPESPRMLGTCVHQFFGDVRPRVGSDYEVSRGGFSHSIAYYHRREHLPPRADRPHRPATNRLDCPWDPDGVGFTVKSGSTIYRRELLDDYGGFDGDTLMAGDFELHWRVLRFEPVGNVPRVLYSRRYHRGSLTADPATGYLSAARQAFGERAVALHRQVDAALADGDLARARALCRKTMECSRVQIAERSGGLVL